MRCKQTNPTNVKKQFIKHPYSYIDSNPNRFGLLSPTRGQITFLSVLKQAQLFQGHTACKNKENYNTEVNGGGGLELVKVAREPASSRPKPCTFLKNAQESCPLAAACGPSEEENRPWSEISFPLRNLPVRAFDSRAQKFSTPLTRRRLSSPPPSPKLVPTHPIERATVRLRVLLRLTRLSATVPLASCKPPPPEGRQIEARKRRT